MSLKTTYRPTPFHAGPSAHSAPVHSRTSGVLPIMYFRNRSSWTTQTPDRQRPGSGPTGNPCDCADRGDPAIDAAAAAAAVRKARRSTTDGRGEDVSVM